MHLFKEVSNKSNHDQTTLTAAFSDCALVWRGSNELNCDQIALSAACSGCAEVRRGLNESNHDQMLSLLLAQAVQRFGEVQMSFLHETVHTRSSAQFSCQKQTVLYTAQNQTEKLLPWYSHAYTLH